MFCLTEKKKEKKNYFKDNARQHIGNGSVLSEMLRICLVVVEKKNKKQKKQIYPQ